jgi:ABC-type sugar transport system ATPase subunit
MIYVTHDRDDATALADSIVEMRDGRVVSIGGGTRSGR